MQDMKDEFNKGTKSLKRSHWNPRNGGGGVSGKGESDRGEKWPKHCMHIWVKKKSQSKNSVESLPNRLDQDEDKISGFKDKEDELEHSDKDKDKNKKVQMNMQDSWVTIKRTHL
jgi:hypothetical protein